MENIVLTVHLIIAFCLIGVVLFQRSEGGGLGIGGGGGATSGRPAISALGKLTWLFGVAFVITSVTLTILAARNATGGSVLDGTDLTPPPTTTVPADDNLLPPTIGDAPLVPPRADD
ncbi:preprotein translocase subunit SecG [Litoreibacter roseus]|nr:preprotein translocase subunit SecG [Litoreibacter roseus]